MSLDLMPTARAQQDQQNTAITDCMRQWPHNAVAMEDPAVFEAVHQVIAEPHQDLRPVLTLLWASTGADRELSYGEAVPNAVWDGAPQTTAVQCDRCDRTTSERVGLVVPFAPRLVVLLLCPACEGYLSTHILPLQMTPVPTN